MKTPITISPELFETIERYYNKDLSSMELKDFERLHTIDDDFKAQVEAVKHLILGVELQVIKEDLDQFHKSVPNLQPVVSSKEKARFKRYKRLAIATALCIALGSIYYFSTPRYEKLYANTFKAYPALTVLQDTSSNSDSEFDIAMKAYAQKTYASAIKIWEQIRKTNRQNDTLNFYLGVAYLANKQESKAIPVLERTVQAKKRTFPLRKEAHFYLALAYLKLGYLKPSKKHLKLSGNSSSKTLFSKLQ